MENSLKVMSFSLGELSTNCYIVVDKKSAEAVIIDPADAGEFLVQKVLEKELKVKMIIATHGHFDHILAATYLQLALKVPFLIHKEDEFLLDRMQDSAIHFLGTDPGPKPTISANLKDGDSVSVGDISLDVIHTPGHTPGSISLLTGGKIFVGDLLFASGGVGRTDFKYSNNEKLKRSIKKILSFPKETMLLSGHGGPTLVGRESIFHK